MRDTIKKLAMFVTAIGWLMLLPVHAQSPDTQEENSATVPAEAAPEQTTRLSSREELLSTIQTQGQARVIVGLQSAAEPAAALSADAATQSDRRERRRQAIARLQQRILNQLGLQADGAVRQFKHIPYMVLNVDAAQLERLSKRADIASIQPVRRLYPVLDVSVPLIGAPAVWSAGYSGQNQAVAILDTGVDKSHSFLAGKVIAEACFSTTGSDGGGGAATGATVAAEQYFTLCPNGMQSQIGPGAGINCTGYGSCSHGTHVAGIAAGKSSTFNGVAKDASLVAIQVFSRSSSNQLAAFDSDIIEALDYIYGTLRNSMPNNIAIASINMSLGGDVFGSIRACDLANPAFKAAVDNLRAVGIATVIAAGNSGSTTGIAYPGCISSVVSVGATNDSDQVASFSNRASWLSVFAPGVSIYSSVPGGYANFSGTSMATPHVAGAIAVLKSRAPQASVDELVAALVNNGVAINDSASGYTVPRIRLDTAAAALAPNAPTPIDLILDNESVGTISQGSFSTIAGSGNYGGRALRSSTTGVNSFRFPITVPKAGYYRLYGWWAADAANAGQATYTVKSFTGLSTLVVDQRSGDRQWNELGVFSLDTQSSAYYVEIGNPRGGSVVADALRLVYLGNEALPLTIETTQLPDGFINTSYRYLLKASGGVSPYTWSVITGALPSGLTLESATGIISGIPTQEGVFDIGLKVQDSGGNAAPPKTLRLTILGVSARQLTLIVSADNAYEVYLNGVLLGSGNNWMQAGSYNAFIQPGKNVIAVKGIDLGGVAGLILDARWQGASSGKVVSDRTWKVAKTATADWQQVNFDDSSWVAATQYGAYGVAPWSTGVAGFPADSTAQWIWSANNDADDTVYLRYTWTLGEVPLAVNTASLASGTVGVAYQATLQAGGGQPPYRWSVVSGSLPAGLSLNPDTGVISGTPTTAGTANFSVQVSDAAGRQAGRALSLTVAAAPPPTTPATLILSVDNGYEVYLNGVLLGSGNNWMQAGQYSLSLPAGKNVIAVKGIDAGGVAAVLAELSWSGQRRTSDRTWKVATTAPTGWQQVNFDDSSWVAATAYGAYGVAPWSTGVAGFPADSTAQWIWSANNDADDTVYLRYTWTLGEVPLAVNTASLASGTVGVAYQATLQAGGGQPPYRWSVVSGSLPAGLSLNPDTGVISGTPTTAGTANFSVQVSDAAGRQAGRALSLTVAAAPPPTTPATLILSVDNGYEVYLNGVLLGSGNNWMQAGQYSLSLPAGKNVIAVKGIDAGGVAAVLAELSWSGQRRTSDRTWKVATTAPTGWQQVNFDDSSWVAATAYGAYGVAPWSTGVAGFPADSTAQWIWSANNDADDTVYLRYTLTLGEVPLAVNTTSLASGTVGVAYQATLQAGGGQPPYRWSLVSGSLPAGLSLNPDTGVISGAPTTVGTASFSVQVNDAAGHQAGRALSLTVAAAPPPTTAATLILSADNGYEVYLNGVLLGSGNNWKQAGQYALSLPAGKNVIAVKGIDAGGVAAVLAELSWSGQRRISDRTWKVATTAPTGWQQVNFDDSSWVAASQYGPYGAAPWYKQVAGFPTNSTAQWIWSANNDADDTVYLRYTFSVP
ncbi:MAG: putative Ig domain-containing protein [Candidatus Competibacteraceae bacterium]